MTAFDALNDAVVDVFGDEPAQFLWPAEAAQELGVVFDRRHVLIDNGGEVGASVLVTSIALQPSRLRHSLAAGDSGTRVTVAGTQYRVVDIRPDGQDWIVAQLAVAAEGS